MENGKLQRFNDQTRVIYYRLDTLSGTSSWDYTKWNFLKDEIVKAAFSDWERALGGRITFKQTTDPKLTDIAVHWRNNFNGTDILGLERPRTVYGGKYLIDADIQITLTANGRTLSDKQLKAIALHEIGHALGLNGHSPYPGDIMYPSIQPGVYRLSTRDIQTIRGLYERQPHITNPPGVHLYQFRQALSDFEKGWKAYQKKQTAQAHKSFVSAHKHYPNDPTYALLAGLTAYETKNYPQAVAYLEKAVPHIKHNPGEAKFYLAEAYLMQGQAELQSGNTGKASQYLQKAHQQYALLLKDKNTPTTMKKSITQRKQWLQQTLGRLGKT